MPICAFAAATARSAAAMSGRRCSNPEGTVRGTAGTLAFQGATGTLNSAGAFPTSSAIACSRTARWPTVARRFARVVSSWVRASSTSVRWAMPSSYWFCVMRSERS